jgi:hypothetical protein
MSIKSTESILETPSNPIIKYGGQSNSDILNIMNTNLRADILTLYSYASDIGDTLAKATEVFTMQAAAISSKVSALSSQLSALLTTFALSSNATIVSMYSLECQTAVLDGISTAADISTTYGQATLHINNETNKLITEDANGDAWIPESVSVGYCYKPAGSTPPQDYEYTKAVDYKYALDIKNETAWVEKASEVTDVWIKVQLPVEVFTNDYVNTIAIHPYPALTQNLKGVYYRPYGSSWIACDLSYLPNYSVDKVLAFGNSRLFFPPSKVSDILIHLELPDASNLYWGFIALEAKMTEFAANSKLTLDFTPIVGAATYSSPVYTVRGKDETTLAYISNTISTKTVEFNLTQNMAGASPVITAVESTWV